jgi:hypothetical protein
MMSQQHLKPRRNTSVSSVLLGDLSKNNMNDSMVSSSSLFLVSCFVQLLLFSYVLVCFASSFDLLMRFVLIPTSIFIQGLFNVVNPSSSSSSASLYFANTYIAIMIIFINYDQDQNNIKIMSKQIQEKQREHEREQQEKHRNIAALTRRSNQSSTRATTTWSNKTIGKKENTYEMLYSISSANFTYARPEDGPDW